MSVILFIIIHVLLLNQVSSMKSRHEWADQHNSTFWHIRYKVCLFNSGHKHDMKSEARLIPVTLRTLKGHRKLERVLKNIDKIHQIIRRDPNVLL